MTRYWAILISFLSISTFGQQTEVYNSKSLIVKQLTKHSFVHTSYLQTESFGNVACNGMLVIENSEAYIFDTPTTNQVANELIDYLESRKIKVVAVVVTHFHDDCLGGLAAFHKRNIPSFATKKTKALATNSGVEIPINSFKKRLNLANRKVKCFFLGQGHTKDNIVCYYAPEKVLFGGCLVKELKATKGYLGDANVGKWPETVLKVKRKFPLVEIIIPGHGKPGNTELLNYTIELFKPTQE